MSDAEPYLPPCGCTGCTAPTGSGWAVCTRHGVWAGNHLAQLDDEYRLLTAAPQGGASSGPHVSGGVPKHLRSPVNLDVVVATDPRSLPRREDDPDASVAPAALAWALGYSEQIRVERELGGPVARTVTFAASRRRISDHLDWCLRQHWAGLFCDQLREIHAAMRRLNSAPIPRPRKATCRAPRDGGVCGGILSWDGERAVCARCDGTWSGLGVLRPGAGAA